MSLLARQLYRLILLRRECPVSHSLPEEFAMAEAVDAFVPLELTKEIACLKSEISAWIEHADLEMRSHLRWQLLSGSKYFRPVTLFACHKAMGSKRVSPAVLRSAVALEL